MRIKSLNSIKIFLLIGLITASLWLGLFVWNHYFQAISPISIEEEIPSYLPLQSIKKAAQLRRELSLLTSASPSARLKKATQSAEVKGEKTFLSIEIINLSGEERSGFLIQDALVKQGFNVKSLISRSMTVSGVRIYSKPTVSQDKLTLIENIFQGQKRIIKKEKNLPLNFFVDIRIFLGR